MKIYTKTGDKGETSLLGGTRVSKAHQKIEAYGTVDELNAIVGMLVSSDDRYIEILKEIQNNLFNIGSLLATEREVNFKLPEIVEEDITRLEKAIDEMNDFLPELRTFVLPGGNMSNAYAHMARTVCRRAERRVVVLDGDQDIIIRYLNRLSDYFFVLGRAYLYHAGLSEDKWSK